MNRQRFVFGSLIVGLLAVMAALWPMMPLSAPVQASSPAASALAAPASAPAAAPAAQGRAPLGSNAYGLEHFTDSLVSFDVNNSSLLNYITFYSGNNLFVGAEFLPGDNQTLYAIEGISGTLSAIDTFSGQKTLIGSLSPLGLNELWTGMATDPVSGVVYASAGEAQCSLSSVSQLYTIDLSTAQTTFVGSMSGGPCIIGIAFDNQGQLYGLEIVNDELIKIDKTTGASSVVGPVGFNANFSQGMDFDEQTGTMYLAAYDGTNFVAELRIADLATGDTTVVDFLGSGSDAELGTIAFGRVNTPTIISNIDPATGGQIAYADPQGIRTTIDVPPNAVTETTSLFFNPVRDPGAIPGFTYANRAFELEVGLEFAFLPIVVQDGVPAAGTQPLPTLVQPAPASGQGLGGSFTFLQPVTMTIEYTDADISQIQDEGSLRLYYRDVVSGRWLDALNTCPQPGGYTSDPATNTVQLQVCHLTRFGLVGN